MSTKTAKKQSSPPYLHASGQYAKRISGKTYYFGQDRNEAMKRYYDECESIKTGTPRNRQAATIKSIIDRFLSLKRSAVESKLLSAYTYRDYIQVGDRIAKFFGEDRHVASLRPADFDAFMVQLSNLKPETIKQVVAYTRTIFGWSLENKLIEDSVSFGSSFKAPRAVVLMRAKQEARRDGQGQMIDRADILKLLDAAGLNRVFVLLGINCGYGQTDIAQLGMNEIDLTNGFVSRPRSKTAIPRRCPLWPETIQAINDSIDATRFCRDDKDSNLAFLTPEGRRWVRIELGSTGNKPKHTDELGYWYTRILKQLGIKHRGGFYNLRHAFCTIADEAKDPAALDCIMGHSGKAMIGKYRERLTDDRLVAVTNHVRNWLWPVSATSTTPGLAA